MAHKHLARFRVSNMKKTAIIVAIVLFGSVGTYLFWDSPETETIAEIYVGGIGQPVTIENITFTTSNLRFATSTDENDNETKTGLLIPIRIATSTGFVDETIRMNFDGYNQCRGLYGKSQAVCIGELNDDIEQNIEAFTENKLRELREQGWIDFEDEIDLKNI